MNLSKLFELQKALDAPYSHVEDRLSKDILWLMEELGELAREYRGHKYRRPAEEQQPKHKVKCPKCNGYGFDYQSSADEYSAYVSAKKIQCTCDNGYIYPLLEEYTDCLSIILSIGNTLEYRILDYRENKNYDNFSIDHMFMWIFRQICDFDTYKNGPKLWNVANSFFHLGFKLGFTWEQIESNYLQKAEANAKRNC